MLKKSPFCLNAGLNADLVVDVVAEAINAKRTPRPRVGVAVGCARAVSIAC